MCSPPSTAGGYSPRDEEIAIVKVILKSGLPGWQEKLGVDT